MLLRQRRHQRLRDNRLRIQVIRNDRRTRKRYINAPLPQGRPLMRRVHLEQVQRDIRESTAKPTQDIWKDVVGRRRHEPHADSTQLAPRRPTHIDGGLLDVSQDLTSLGQQHAAGVGQLYLSARASKESGPKFPLKLLYLLTERRLRDGKP